MVWSVFIFSYGQLLLFFGLASLWVAGGFLIARAVFSLSTRESLPVGIGIGALLIIVLTNIASYGMNLQGATLLSSITVFIGGVLCALLPRPKRDLFQNWQQMVTPLLAFLLLFVLFLKINQGLAIFDENYNLPIVSRIAAGDAPPHFPFDPRQPLAYHYGLHLLAAMAVRIGGISPWLAFDAVRAMTHALMLILAALWFERKVGGRWAAIGGAIGVYFGGNTQWLLLLAPPRWVEKLNSLITLSNSALSSGTSLSDLLTKNWNIDGLGAVSFPFAYIGAVFRAQNFALTSNGASVALTIFLLFLIVPKRWQIGSAALVSLLVASLALTAEYLFALLMIGMALTTLLRVWQEKRLVPMVYFLLFWLPPLGLALFGGGVIQGMVQQALQGLNGGSSLSGHGFLGFEWYFPPSLPTLYFGRLSLFQRDTLLFSLLLLAPLVFFVSLSLKQFKRQWHSMDVIQQSMLSGACVSLLVCLVVGITDSVGGITRLMDAALLIILIFSLSCLPSFWQNHPRSFLNPLIALNFFLLVFGGLVTFVLELIAIPSPQATFYVSDLDVRFYERYWDRLPAQAQVFDPKPARAVVLFGRSVGSIAADYNEWLPEWQALLENPLPQRLVQEGYSHAYLDRRFWNKLSEQTKAAWKQDCVRLIEEQNSELNFRRLYDLQGCRQ